MNAAEDKARARAWLSEQVEQLDGLRNASPRDPSFKHWRQNTLTVLQRIWPQEPYRSERFRRIAFSPSSPKPTGQLIREWYTRGCTDANEYLQQLIEEVEIVGVVNAAETHDAPAETPEMGAADDGVPVIDLNATPAPATGQPPAYSMEDNVLDLGGARDAKADPSGDALPPALKVGLRPLAARPDVDTHAPAPQIPAPRLAVPADSPQQDEAAERAATPASDSRLILPHMDSALVDAPPGIERTPQRPGASSGPRRGKAAKAKKPAPKGKLKNLLGLDYLDPESASNPGGPEEGTGAAAPEVIAPAAESGSAPTPPAARVSPTPMAPVSMPPAASVSPPPPPPAPASVPPAQPPVPPEPANAAEAEAEADAAQAFDAEALSRATEDFLKNSLVLGLQGKPVQRSTDVTQFLDPDAVAVATLAADLARLGVPEAERLGLRATLLDLSAQIDAGHPTWDAVRDAVTESMAYADLARRLVPVLLPWFTRAA